jgi:hypothetical protein
MGAKVEAGYLHTSGGYLTSVCSHSDSGLDLPAQGRARKAIVEKAKRAPPHSSRTRAIITAFRFSPDYVPKRRANRLKKAPPGLSWP